MLSSPLVRRLIHLAIEEDLSFDDVTSNLSIPEESRGYAEIIAKQPLVVCGTPLIEMIFSALSAEVEIEIKQNDGKLLDPCECIATIQGKTRSLLAAERMLLNFLQRMSGVATLTRKFVEKAGDLVVLDTRKTLPGWRILDKYAVSTGGARNHRFHLGDMVLVKNNHVDAAAGRDARERMRNTLIEVFTKKPVWMPVEVEVRSLEELETALSFKPQIVMLDNMNDPQIKEALAVIAKSSHTVQVEVSGSVSLDRLESLRSLGVSCVSVGALTTQASNVDISLRLSEIRR